MNREGIQRLTKEKISQRIREGVKGRCLRRFIWGRGPKEDWAFKRYTDMAPALGHGRETHKNRDLKTCTYAPWG